MRKVLFFIIVLAIAALFITPESAISEYKGLISAKYFLRDSAVKAKSIVSSLIRGERPKELDVFQNKAKETLEQSKQEAKDGARDVLKDSVKNVVDGL